MTARVGGRRAVESWMFLGVRFDVLTSPGAPVAVAEMLLPEGASPPAHVHDGLDDSFYLLDGIMVVRCGGELSVARPGSWQQFPSGVPHTFRVMGGPARALSIHSDDSFLALVRDVGHPADRSGPPGPGDAPTREQLDRMLYGHGITNVGPPIEQDEAEEHLRVLAAAGR